MNLVTWFTFLFYLFISNRFPRISAAGNILICLQYVSTFNNCNYVTWKMYRIFASVNAMAVLLSGAFIASTSSTTSQWAKLVSTVLTTWRIATDIIASQPMAWNVEWLSLIGNCLDLQFKCAKEIKLLSTSRITCPARVPVSTGTDCTWLVLSSFIDHIRFNNTYSFVRGFRLILRTWMEFP